MRSMVYELGELSLREDGRLFIGFRCCDELHELKDAEEIRHVIDKLEEMKSMVNRKLRTMTCGI